MAAKKSEKKIAEKKARKSPQGGKSRGKRKLTNEQVLDIVSQHSAGKAEGQTRVTMKALAAQFGVATPTVSAILNGRTYVWLTGIGAAPVSEDLAEAA